MEKGSNLIVGGASGLGLELARSMHDQGEEVIVTGRRQMDMYDIDFAEFRRLDICAENTLPAYMGRFVAQLPPIKTLVYNAGFFQEGHITDLRDEQIDNMIDVGGRAPMFIVKKLLEKQGKLDEFIAVTSTSQWVPREFEPVYNMVKAGLGHYAHGQSLDPRVGKTIVVGPSGMTTDFWEGTDKDTSNMMDPAWVAEQVMDLRQTDRSYTFAKILGANGSLPDRVEIEEVEPRDGSCNSCFSHMYSRDPNELPKDCPGLVERGTQIPDGVGGEGYFVQVCPRQKWLNSGPSTINFSGNGSDVLVLHGQEALTREGYEQAIKDNQDAF